MKKHFLFRMGLLILCLWVFSSQAQTLVNQTASFKGGVIDKQYNYFKALPLPSAYGGGQVFIQDNYSVVTGSSELITTTDSTNTMINSVDLAPLNGNGLATAIRLYNSHLYVAGMTPDSLGANSIAYHLISLDVNTLDTTWMVSVDSSASPFSVLVDDSNYIFLGLSIRTGPSSGKISVLKFDRNGNKIWQSNYDSTGFYNLPVAMVISGSYVIVTGFNFNNTGTSNFLTYELSRNTGVNDVPKYSSNGVGAISHPVSICVDSLGTSYVAGTSTVSGSASVIKILTYNSAFVQQSLETYGDSTKTNTLAAFCIDGQNNQAQNILLAGTTIDGSGHHSIAVLKYGIDGTLKWSKAITAANPAYPTDATDITYDATGTGNVYVTGTQYNGSDTDILTLALDSSSNILWQKTYGRGFGTNEVPYNISSNSSDGSISVTGRSFGTDSQYVLLNLTQDKTNNAPDSTKPSQQWAYYENLGQVIDTGTNQASYVHYYTNTANPRLYITDYALSYVFSSMDSLTDSLQRIDMTLEKSEIGNDPTTPTYYGTEQIKPYFNYYIGGLPQYYEDVHGYQRITVKGIYNNIDCQLYSDSGGLKYYYVVNPGGSPTDIQFKYTGADSITHDSTGMKIYSRYGVASQLPFTAWQYSSGSATQISLTLSAVSSTEFTFSVGSYNSSLPLYIRMTQQAQATAAAADSIQNLTWSTYFGGSGDDWAKDIDIDNHHQQFVTGNTTSNNFPIGTGQSFNNSSALLGSFLSSFDSTSVLQYSSFYTGSTRAIGTTQNIKHNTNAVAAGFYNHYDGLYQTVYIAGQTPYIDLPCPQSRLFSGGLRDTVYAGGEADGFVALFNGYNGALQQASYIGSDGEDGINTLEIDRDTSRNYNELYIGGYTMGTNFPFQNNSFSGNFYDNQGRAVLMQLDNSMNAVWSTGFGSHTNYFSGTGDSVACSINDIKLDNAGNILIVGNSYFSFPSGSPYSIAQPTGAFRVPTHPNTSTTPPTNAFLAKFKPGTGSAKNQYSLYYFSEYGDNEFDNGQKICANSTNDIYIAGQGFRNYLTQDTSFDYITTGQGSDGAYIVRFSPDGVLLANGDYGGCLNITFGDMYCDANDNVFVFGGTGVNNSLFSALQQTGWYWDSYVSTNKCFLAEVDPSNAMLWSTLFGGYTKNQQGGMCIDRNSMYICGMTTTNDANVTTGFLQFPLVDNTVSSFYPYGGDGPQGGDAFLARFKLRDVTLTSSVSNVTANSNPSIKCYPNPSNGTFIVSFSDFANGDKTVTLYDYMGQSLYTTHTSNNSITIDGADKFSTGIYIVEVQSASRKEINKIVISQ